MNKNNEDILLRETVNDVTGKGIGEIHIIDIIHQHAYSTESRNQVLFID
jgi:hypothetical protein